MNDQAEALLRKALSLPEQHRADVAARLLASLDAPEPDDEAVVQPVWAQELEQRARRALSGRDPGEDWSQVRDKLADDLTG